MSIVTVISNLAVRIGTEFKTAYIKIGVLTALTTTDKSSVVAAINEVKASVSGAAGINDGSTGAASTWSSTKINNEITASRNSLLGGASAAYDTFIELQTKMEADDTEAANILAALGTRVRFDAAQSLTAGEATQARANIGAQAASEIGDPNTNFVTIFEAALA